MLSSNPAEDKGTNKSGHDETDGHGQPEHASELTANDDDSVPDKQISRWKDEGGSFMPAAD